MLGNLALLVACLSLATATAERRAAVSPAFLPRGAHWKRAAKVPADQVIHIDVALTLNDRTLGDAATALEDIADPGSSKFGQHLSPRDAAELFAPPKEHVREVARWLNDSGVARSGMRLSLDRAHISFDAPVGDAERLLGAEFHLYSSGDEVQIASESYSVPSVVSAYVDYVMPAPESASVGYAPDSVKMRLKDAALQARQAGAIDCFRFATPHCLRLLYGMDDGKGVTPHPNNSLGFFTPSYSTWLSEDMQAFFSSFAPELVGQEPVMMPIDGGYRYLDQKLVNFNLEPNLDYQYSMALAYPQPVTNIQVGDKYQIGNLNTMLAAFDETYCTALDPAFDPTFPSTEPDGYNSSDCGTHVPPRVIGIAYAWNEAQFSETYVQRQCLEFLKLGLQGVTILTGSADRGTADQLGACINPETGAPDASQGHFSSVFPASCPWVTAVGATQLMSAGNETWEEGKPFPGEGALDHNGTQSGGGFSRLFPTPWYQGRQTSDYLAGTEAAQQLGESGYFNPHGRGYPDISALGLNYLVNIHGSFRAVRGTSASVPLVASMFAKINQERLEAGKGTIGFVNPVLYASREKIFRDVTAGRNGGCGVEVGFEAASGWDAVTGLGSPDYAKLRDLYLSLP